MSAEDWMPYFFDPDGDDDEGLTLCRYCNCECFWVDLDLGYKLFEVKSGEQHVCPKLHKPAAADEFEDLDAPVG